MVNFRIICAHWGDLYDKKSVDILHNQVKRNCSIPYSFHVIDKFDNTFLSYHEKYYRGKDVSLEPREVIHNGYHRDDFGGIPHHRKIELFEKDKMFDRGDRILYLDLDTQINGDLKYFYDLDDQKPWIVKNYWWERDQSTYVRQYHITRCPLFNSSVLRWTRGQNRWIYNFLQFHSDKAFFTYPSIDTFLFHQFGPFTPSPRRNHFVHFEEEIVTTERESSNIGLIHMLEGLSHHKKLDHATNYQKHS